jgi:hypothetical protein
MEVTTRSLKFGILQALSSGRAQHKFNIIGKGYGQGPLESSLNVQFDPDQRHLAVVAFDELRAGGFIRPTYTDVVDPEAWVEITDAGRRALQRKALDALDIALSRIAPHLVEVREGAWAAIATSRPDALRQAAHSARELIEQSLKIGAPDDAVRATLGFAADPSSKSGVTRRHRLKYLMLQNRGVASDSDLKIAEQACDLALATDEKLKAMAHSREPIAAGDVRDALLANEIALRKVLISETDAV